MESKRYITQSDIINSLANLKQLVFEVTDACNLRCKYCSYGELYSNYDLRENKVLPLMKAIKLIDYLFEFWKSDFKSSLVHIITISFYGGEPLLNMSFIKGVVDYVTKLSGGNLQFKFSMTTNAILLHKYMDYLATHDFALLISLDGNEENTSYRIDYNGQNAYTTIIKNVDLLKSTYPDYFDKKINFNAVLHNKNSVDSIYYFFKEKYDKKPRIGEINDVGIKEEMKETFFKTYRNMQENLFQSENYEEIEDDLFMGTGNYQELATYLFQHSGFSYKDYTELLFEVKDIPIPTGTCLPFAKKMFVTVNGKILPCERIGHQFALGEIKDESIDLDLENIANKYNAYYSKLIPMCFSCKRIKSCTQCMFNLKNIETIPQCYGYTNTQNFKKYEEAQIRFLQKHPNAYKEIMENMIML